MDCGLPQIDGFDSARHITNILNKYGINAGTGMPKLIALSDHIESEHVKRAIDTGFDLIFQKPLDLHDLEMLLYGYGFAFDVSDHFLSSLRDNKL
mmetsp:Transcript_9089/g.15341  ORF Transcript_9089/g.15341 Transcript_9089/m.15341 type:complete len:95 (+) Transcript_9089:647-931(+)